MATKKVTTKPVKETVVKTAKTEEPIKTSTKETAKPVAKKPVEKKAPAKVAAKPAEKAPAKAAAKTTTAKAATKTTTAKKTAVKKDMKVTAVVEYYGKQVEEKELIARVKKAWTRSGKKVGDIKSMELYIKPEDGAVYYVINGKETGAVGF